MAEKQSKEPSSTKHPETFPGAPQPYQPWYPGQYTTYYQMVAYPQPHPLGSCPFHVPSAGQPFTPIYGCPYCAPLQPPQQSQNINISVGGFVPGSNIPLYQNPGYPTLLPVAANISGWGWSPYQTTWPGQSRPQQDAMIHARSDNRPQDMQPSDPDPWRFYTVKELDGGVTSRNRYTIDSGEIGKVRWYQTPEGVFYAVIVPDSKA